VADAEIHEGRLSAELAEGTEKKTQTAALAVGVRLSKNST
jgi:hypothetical protein